MRGQQNTRFACCHVGYRLKEATAQQSCCRLVLVCFAVLGIWLVRTVGVPRYGVDYSAKHLCMLEFQNSFTLSADIGSLNDLWLACGAKPSTLGCEYCNKVDRVSACICRLHVLVPIGAVGKSTAWGRLVWGLCIHIAGFGSVAEC
jgi:hypothetical protein